MEKEYKVGKYVTLPISTVKYLEDMAQQSNRRMNEIINTALVELFKREKK